jgi:YHS domain-containing protein
VHLEAGLRSFNERSMEESNRKIQQSVDRSRQQRVEMQEKLAYLVNDFDKLMDEQRFSEAQVLAKRATELDPDNPLVLERPTFPEPVISMSIEPKTAADKATYKGKTYYFCSKEDKATFMKSPEKYVKADDKKSK